MPPDGTAHVDETALTPKAIVAVDDHWSMAELRGNTAWLGSLLLPNYESVRPDDPVWNKDALLVHAARNRGRGMGKLKAFDV